MIYLRSQREIAAIESAGKIVGEAIERLVSLVTAGISTIELDVAAEKFIRAQSGKPAFKGYRGFPASICASINEEIVHGIPSERRLKEGDLISIDLGVEKNGFFADAAVTVAVGKIEKSAQKLIEVTHEALFKGIDKAKVGNKISDISYAIEQAAKKENFDVVREYVGHGIGTKIHEDPAIPNFGEPNKGPLIKKGMILAIEPMLCGGSWETDVLKDGWTVVTKDRKLSAHFEHTIAVTDEGPRILTLWQKKKL